MNIICSAQPCPVILNSTCVFYQGENLISTGIVTNDNVQTALQKIDAKILNIILGYVPNSRTITINGITADLSANRSWNIAAGLSSVSATPPLFSTGGVSPNISIQQSSSTSNGYLSSTNWNTFNNKLSASTAALTYFPLIGGALTGTAGAGYVGLISQSSNPATPSSGVNIFANSSGAFGWINTAGWTRSFSNPAATSNLAFTLPNTSGTLALTSDLTTGYVPYTGANTNVSLGAFSLSTGKQLTLTATDGTGYIQSAWQSSSPAGVASNTTLWFDATGRINWRPSTGFIRTFDATTITADRTWILPNRSITFDNITAATTTDLAAGFLKSNGTNVTFDSNSYLTAVSSGTNYLPKFASATTIGNSLVFDNGSGVVINGTVQSGLSTLTVNASGTNPGITTVGTNADITSSRNVIAAANMNSPQFNILLSGTPVMTVAATTGYGTISSTTGYGLRFSTNASVVGYWHTNGNLGIGSLITVPSAALHLRAGTFTASTAPLKFSSGTNLSIVENGTFEFDGTNFYCTANGTRQNNLKGYSGSFSATGTATTAFTVTFGGTQPNATYQVLITPTNVLTAAVLYVTSKTTTTFTVTFITGLTGTVAFDWLLVQ